ncbi:hypothetical protein PSW70_23530, partial [Shigella flexneri]|nr:hypothetical protein [Shigella flexneri]
AQVKNKIKRIDRLITHEAIKRIDRLMGNEALHRDIPENHWNITSMLTRLLHIKITAVSALK